jgi:hypothetical protein
VVRPECGAAAGLHHFSIRPGAQVRRFYWSGRCTCARITPRALYWPPLRLVELPAALAGAFIVRATLCNAALYRRLQENLKVPRRHSLYTRENYRVRPPRSTPHTTVNRT